MFQNFDWFSEANVQARDFCPSYMIIVATWLDLMMCKYLVEKNCIPVILELGYWIDVNNGSTFYRYRSRAEGNLRLVKLRTSDLVNLEVDTEIVRCSLTILSKLAALDTEAGEKLIDLPEVCSVILEKVIEWARFHKVWLLCFKKYKRFNLNIIRNW